MTQRAQRSAASDIWRRRAVVALPMLWLALFFLVPFIIVLKISVAEMRLAVPPYTPLLNFAEDGTATIQATFDNFRFLISDSLYIHAYLGSLKIAAVSTLLTLMIGYPLAYAIARAPASTRGVLLLLVMLPFWTSFLIRVYAWIGILRPGGILNTALQSIGLLSEPLQILNTEGAVYLGIVYAYLPFMVLPLYARLERMNPELLEAAADLGAAPWRAFLSVTLPLSLPGIIAGCLLVFIPATGEFVIPELMGGPDTLMVGKVLWSEFFTNRDWPVSSALAIILLVLLVAPIVAFQAFQSDETPRGARP